MLVTNLLLVRTYGTVVWTSRFSAVLSTVSTVLSTGTTMLDTYTGTLESLFIGQGTTIGKYLIVLQIYDKFMPHLFKSANKFTL